jgi:hypothetical protein
VKTTIELPDAIFREAKIHAATHGVTFKELITDLLQAHLKNPQKSFVTAKPWMAGFGALGKSKTMRKETRRIEKLIEKEFEVIDPEDWR